MKKKIKVCFVATYAWALFNQDQKTPFGGSEIQLYQLSREIAKDPRFEVSFIVGDFGQPSPLSYGAIKVYKGFIPPEQVITDLKQISIKWALSPALKLWRALSQVQADIYIQRAATWVTGVTTFFCRLFRKKFIYMTACEIDVSGEYSKRYGLRGKLFEQGLRQADLIIVQHTDQKTLLRKNFNKTGVLIKSPFYPIENLTASKNTSSIKGTILWVGRSDELKNPARFLQLTRQFAKEKFVMICQPAVYYGNLFQQIKEQAQQIFNLLFIDYVPFYQIDHYFREAKILVNTSDREGFPNTFIQAAKNKTPVLSFKVNPDNFINQYQCGYCAEGDFPKMTGQLRDLLCNQTIWNQMSENAFRYAQENHDINKVIPEFKNLLKTKANKC